MREILRACVSVLLGVLAVVRWKRLSGSEEIKLELGSGAKIGSNGWTTVDLRRADISHDLRRGIPLQDGIVSKLYSSHFLEHLPYPQLLLHLSECLRVLKPGGEFLVAVPNARLYIEAYMNRFELRSMEDLEPAYRCDTGSAIDQLNYVAYMGGAHKFMFDEENLQNLLTRVGFAHVSLREFEDGLDRPDRNHTSIYAIGVKDFPFSVR